MTELDEVADSIWERWDNYIRRYPVDGPRQATLVCMKDATPAMLEQVEEKLRLRLLLVGERHPDA